MERELPSMNRTKNCKYFAKCMVPWKLRNMTRKRFQLKQYKAMHMNVSPGRYPPFYADNKSSLPSCIATPWRWWRGSWQLSNPNKIAPTTPLVAQISWSRRYNCPLERAHLKGARNSHNHTSTPSLPSCRIKSLQPMQRTNKLYNS